MRALEVAWSDESEAHIARHNVAPREVEEVLSSRPLLYRKGREGTRYVFGKTYAGRLLLIVLADAADGRDWIVTARDMTPREAREFRKHA